MPFATIFTSDKIAMDERKPSTKKHERGKNARRNEHQSSRERKKEEEEKEEVEGDIHK